jgi:hypothetical protein
LFDGYMPYDSVGGRLAPPHRPHVGRLSSQVKPCYEATSLRTVLGIVHLSAQNTRELRRTPGSQEERHGSPN